MVPHLAGLVCAALLGLIGAGCQALQQVDWDRRIGQFSYGQAVAELGRPDGETKLSGGMRRVEWITNTGISTGRAGRGRYPTPDDELGAAGADGDSPAARPVFVADF